MAAKTKNKSKATQKIDENAAAAPASPHKSSAAKTIAKTASAAEPPVFKLPNPAIQAYELGLNLMHTEEYQKAAAAFKNLLTAYPDELEIQERARVLLQAAEKKVHEKCSAAPKSADDHYNMGIAELNRRQMESAVRHFQSALTISPKGEHILYAMAAAHTLQGNRDEAVAFLKQSIQYRPANRFLAARDSDFERLRTDSEFQQLLASPEKLA